MWRGGRVESALHRLEDALHRIWRLGLLKLLEQCLSVRVALLEQAADFRPRPFLAADMLCESVCARTNWPVLACVSSGVPLQGGIISIITALYQIVIILIIATK